MAKTKNYKQLMAQLRAVKKRWIEYAQKHPEEIERNRRLFIGLKSRAMDTTYKL